MSAGKNITRFPEIKEPLLRELGAPGRNTRLVPSPFDAVEMPGLDLRDDLDGIPDVSEVEIVRHYTRVSRLNFGLDHGMYPLGSCTMKHNPKINEVVAARLGAIHPFDTAGMQDVLGCLDLLSDCLESICGMDAVTLWPAAGAHGELTGMMVIRKAVDASGRLRKKVLIPDTAHGTNPASCAIAGFSTENIPTGTDGYLRAETLAGYLDDDVAALMITNPNTLGVFEKDIKKIADLLHENGSYLYMDGANMNALIGNARPGDMGVDCMHLNLHKTFGTPHGGGGPGSGPVLVKKELEGYLPVPKIEKDPEKGYFLSMEVPESIGMIHSCVGNTAVLIKALAYILSLGPKGIREASTMACLNAGYLKKELSGAYELPFAAETLHEFVLSDRFTRDRGITTMDVAKALMEYGFHPPTVYFPLVVSGAIMIEPTESESIEELDRFIWAMIEIAAKAEADEPEGTPTGRVDEVQAARRPVLTWDMDS